MTSEVTVADSAIEIMERVVVQGDLAKLSAEDRVRYYAEVCKSLGLNPLTRPFEYISLNGRLTLYATRTCTDQLRALKGISVTRLEREVVEGIYSVTAYGQDRSGRIDSSIGAVPIETLKGEARANAMMKTETKAKRRLTLSLAGLGWLDEIEVDSVPSAQHTDVDQDTGEIVKPRTLRETVAERRAALEAPHTDPALVTGVESFEPAAIPPDNPSSGAAGSPHKGAASTVASEPGGSSAPSGSPDADAVGTSTMAAGDRDTPAAALSIAAFQSLAAKEGFPPKYVMDAIKATWPKRRFVSDLSDEERGQLWTSLSADLVSVAQEMFAEPGA